MKNTVVVAPGIRKIITTSGARFEARINKRGFPSASQRFEKLKDAQKWKAIAEAKLDAGASRSARKSKGTLISDVIEGYLKYRDEHKPIASHKKINFNRVKHDLGNFALGNLTRKHILNWLKLLTTEPLTKSVKKGGCTTTGKCYAPATIRQFYYALKKAVEWHAGETGYTLDPMLFTYEAGVVPKAWSRRERLITSEEEKRLYEAEMQPQSRRSNTFSQDDWRNIIGFAIETAMREQEICWACWEHMSPNRLNLRIPAEHTKTNTARTVNLSPRAREILEAQRRQCPEEEPRIFFQWPTPKSICVSFGRLVKRAGIADLHFHDCRHTGTTKLCQSGIFSLAKAMSITGHSKIETFLGYVHFFDDDTNDPWK